MSATTSNQAAPVAAQFERHREELPGDSQVRARRSAALTRFAALGFPTRKLEEWRYTDARSLSDGAFELVPSRPDAALIDRARTLVASTNIGAWARRAVFLDGHLIPELSEMEALPGLELLDLAAHIEALAPAAEVTADHALVALNTAFVRQGLVIRVAERAEIERPIHLVFVGSGRGLAPQLRVLIETAPGSAARVVQHFVDIEGGEPGWLNLVTEVRQGAGSRLGVYRFQAHTRHRYQTSVLEASIGRDASLVTRAIDDGGALVRSDYDVTLEAPGARADLVGLALASVGQHVDNHVRVDHRAPHTESRETFRSIVGEKGHAVFNGKIVVREGAQKIDASQRSDNLLLSRQAEVDTRPELEIYADDVKCSHGATVGELDEQHLFYLRARGLDEAAARGLLTFAFANEILERVELPELAELAASRISGHLPDVRRSAHV